MLMVFTTKPLPHLLLLATFGRLLRALAVALSLGSSTWALATPAATLRLTPARCVVFAEISGERARPRAGPRAQPGAEPSLYFR